MKITIRDYLFRDFPSCSNHGCVIKPPVGMGTNGTCHCMSNLSRVQLTILQSRIQSIANVEIDIEVRTPKQ